jgi:hypothetical protein
MPRKTNINAGIEILIGKGSKLKFITPPFETATIIQNIVNIENAA